MVTFTLTVWPWWKRFYKALEILICGAVTFEGDIVDVQGKIESVEIP